MVWAWWFFKITINFRIHKINISLPASIRHKEGNCEQQEKYQRVENPFLKEKYIWESFNQDQYIWKSSIRIEGKRKKKRYQMKLSSQKYRNKGFFSHLKATSSLWERGEDRNLRSILLKRMKQKKKARKPRSYASWKLCQKSDRVTGQCRVCRTSSVAKNLKI